MSPAEVSIPSLRQLTLTENEELNNSMIIDHLDQVEEKRDQALLRVQNYQNLTVRYYNKSVRGRFFQMNDLVLRKVFENTREWKAGKLGANWEGPYLISKIIKPGVYELTEMSGENIPRSWNSLNLKRFYY
ncbi:hypothetical protein Bca101_035340 [Brassica carinata]